LHAEGDPYLLGRVIELQAIVLYRQYRLEDAKLEALNALEIYEKLGATRGVEACRGHLREIERAMNNQGEFLETTTSHVC
jgi:hypothetical protein